MNYSDDIVTALTARFTRSQSGFFSYPDHLSIDAARQLTSLKNQISTLKLDMANLRRKNDKLRSVLHFRKVKP